jgi:hypothetical protein
MSSRTYRCTLALTLALSTGALALPPAQAAPARSDSPPASSIQGNLVTRSVFEALQKLWGMFKDSPHHPTDPDHGPNREGSGVCPHGGGHGGGPHP